MSARPFLLAVPVVILGWLTLAPTTVEPVSWQPPEAPSQKSGVFKSNDDLRNIQRIGDLDIRGPEALLLDDEGFLITGLEDGRIIRTSLDGNSLKVIANTGGRPLGLTRHPDGRLIVADAIRGLISVSNDGDIKVLSTKAGDRAFKFVDDVVVDSTGRFAYFSDASSRWGYGEDGTAIMEHAGDGRLLRYDFTSGETTVLLDGLEFANGVALGPNEEYVLVNETGAYRISRVYLRGDKAGQHDVFIDNLPGLPDNLSFNGSDRFWVALYTPRNPLLDAFSDYPYVRKMLVRAMQVLPAPIAHRAMIIGLDSDGKVVANLQNSSSDSYAPITTVREYDGWLYLGSLKQKSLARWSLAGLPSTDKTPAETQ